MNELIVLCVLFALLGIVFFVLWVRCRIQVERMYERELELYNWLEAMCAKEEFQ